MMMLAYSDLLKVLANMEYGIVTSIHQYLQMAEGK